MVLMLLTSAVAQGSDKDKSYAVVGSISCGRFLETLKTDHGKVIHQAYLMGYITAYNLVKPNTYNILGRADVDSAMLWLENWCKANPLKPLNQGLDSLTDELYPTRHKTAKEGGV